MLENNRGIFQIVDLIKNRLMFLSLLHFKKNDGKLGLII